MRLASEKKVQWGEDGSVTLAEPTNAQWNEYTRLKFPVGKKGTSVRNDLSAAAVWLFDQVYLGHDGLEDSEGPIPPGAKDRLPDRLKAQSIMVAFESDEVTTKN